MPNVSRNLLASDKHERVGPDYFGYYSSEVINLLSRDEDALPAAMQKSERPQSKSGEEKMSSIKNNDDLSISLYNDAIGADLSDIKKERLRSLLRQSVTTLSSEVNEVVDPVFATHHLQSRLKSKRHSLNHTTNALDVDRKIPCKKIKVDDFQSLLENDNVEVEETVKRYTEELSGKLVYMEQHLESLLDAVMSKCRPMTLVEKQQLQRLIQKLPAENLDRVVQIICRSRPVKEQSSDKIFVDLEKEDNATLWRLYYYIEAFEKAKILSS
ncbi:PREDICTED: uncharacterized protein LOC109344383 isoform X1 [Lupinus angustifolius]|uniref:uncharacterized protein LOC109344383 isoform X1 n=1 Tax=Lupinus angustifolius TaxID=3871 RepID=UPI00092F8C81|nr:PREDICTED: uncharacterized protein LOC109344383 isoform X1 [Lupinus angustifolius]XP_019438697.1 PREDICTED: uncharacterized protein LOC109344383 isoform X1 [Lupinus angustifolius]